MQRDGFDGETVHRLHNAAEPRRQELVRRLNQAPGGTAALIRMRETLLDNLRDNPQLKPVDGDFVHLLASWFNRSFLVLRRIDWTTPAHILEKIIRYEAVHEIKNWDDLRNRLASPDRRCYGFFHPQLTDEPLIFVEVALTEEIPEAIAPLLKLDRTPIRAADATTAVFYSISNTQRGLGGISFGNFLIKQVVEELKRELPNLDDFRHAVAGARLHALAQCRARVGEIARADTGDEGRVGGAGSARLARGCRRPQSPFARF